jgi:hypothetical protein
MAFLVTDYEYKPLKQYPAATVGVMTWLSERCHQRKKYDIHKWFPTIDHASLYRQESTPLSCFVVSFAYRIDEEHIQLLRDNEFVVEHMLVTYMGHAGTYCVIVAEKNVDVAHAMEFAGKMDMRNYQQSALEPPILVSRILRIATETASEAVDGEEVMEHIVANGYKKTLKHYKTKRFPIRGINKIRSLYP